MISSLISMLPTIITSVLSIIITWIICRLWYISHYIHRDEVRPLQESQHIMQNQYAILAERIKHTDSQLAEAKAKLEIAANQASSQNDLEKLKLELLEEIRNIVQNNPAQVVGDDETSREKLKEQFNFVRQGLKEFKTEFAQKFNISASQYQEISNQLWQLVELNKKLSNEAENLNKSIQITDQDDKSERHFTLTSIKKRS